MITEEVKKYIHQSVLCWLATSSADNTPNVSPKELFTYQGDTHLLIAHIASPQSVKNIKANKKVCVSFVDVFVQKGFQLKGEATIIDRQHQDFDQVVTPLAKMAGPKFPIHAVISIKVSKVKAIVAPSYQLYPEITEAQQIENAMKTYQVKPQ